jgi:hypothetical protein
VEKSLFESLLSGKKTNQLKKKLKNRAAENFKKLI